ncbi:hypothetical protein HMPREF0497_1543 [Lentilactobacillus buchneri ATCC 11577]|nr:hypothetical protein HMPREF0497_1543 [Lentilactobacillus buchneri ATCC 11577]
MATFSIKSLICRLVIDITSIGLSNGSFNEPVILSLDLRLPRT